MPFENRCRKLSEVFGLSSVRLESYAAAGSKALLHHTNHIAKANTYARTIIKGNIYARTVIKGNTCAWTVVKANVYDDREFQLVNNNNYTMYFVNSLLNHTQQSILHFLVLEPSFEYLGVLSKKWMAI